MVITVLTFLFAKLAWRCDSPGVPNRNLKRREFNAICAWKIVFRNVLAKWCNTTTEPRSPPDAQRLDRAKASCLAASSYTPSASSRATDARSEFRQSGP